MPSLIEGDDRQTVKRTVPKTSNKIHAVAVAKLYVAHPNPQRWTFTGLQGAIVLANDLVGNTFWLKLVDISASSTIPWADVGARELTILQARKSRCHLGSGDLRYLLLQSGPYILSFFRAGRLPRWSVVCR